LSRIVVVGAGAAGLSAAETLRREGFTGTITLVGEELDAPYDRPPLSKQILASQWEAERLALRTEDQIRGLEMDLRLGVRAISLDLASRVVNLEGGAGIGFDGLIIATGVRPRRLPGATAHVLRTVADALALRARLRPGHRLVVVGAGFLGAESASVARSLGCDVVVLEPAAVPMAHAVGQEVGQMLSELHRSRDVDLRTGVAVGSVVEGGVALPDGTLVEADDVLVAIGSATNTEWLGSSGLVISDGVVTDEYCAAAKNVYVAGDVARWHNPLFDVSMRIEHRTNAAEQGLAAARNLLNPQQRKPFAPVPYFWSDQYDLKIQAYGYLRGHEEVSIVEGDVASRRFIAAYRREERLVGVLAAGVSPKALRLWRQAVADRTAWAEIADRRVNR
jgi:NADPH-dependent 2,4-dienoyl-CoA reductase/sulfur reductase-like enzyme